MMIGCCCCSSPSHSFAIPELIFPQQQSLIFGWVVTTNIIKKSNKKKNLRLIVKPEAYRRIPMDTPGAYQLVDDETKEKFIVWGADDDDDDDSGDRSSSRPLPSQQVLSWKPESPQSTEKLNPQGHVGETNFARLKAQKIRALIRKKSPSTTKQHRVTNEDSFRDTNKKAGRVDENTKSSMRRPLDNNVDDDDDVAAPEYEHKHAPNKSLRPSASSTLRGWSGAASDSASGYYSDGDSSQPRVRRKMLLGDMGFFSRKSFKELGCLDDVIESLRSLSFVRPSHIQAMAYAPVLQGKSCIVADQSGSGKTLAYLVPIIQRLRQEELQGLHKSAPKSPRVVVLVPTAELASQVLSNCRAISKNGVPFRSMVVTGGFRQKTQLDNLQQELDVLIATPGRFIYLLQEGFVQLSNLQSVVLDEVDILFGDEGFEQVLQSLINSAPMEAQYVFVTATLPVDIYNKLVQVFPDCEVTMGPGIHRTSSKLEEVLVDCSGNGGEKTPESAFLNKKSALLRLAKESSVQKTIVFCNKIETCRKVENALKRFDRKELSIKVLPFHAALAQDVRLANMKEFLYSKTKDSMFLICTDRASRGIDFQNVDHVVLFDFPRDPSEYVRRVGRTARGAGGEGKAFVFVVGKQVSLARRIMERNKKGHPLHDVPSAYEMESSVL